MRELEESTEIAEEWTPPVVVHGRGPLRTAVQRATLKRVGKDVDDFDSAPKAAMPDLEGVTHIPESKLPQRKDRMEHTATRPAVRSVAHSSRHETHLPSFAGPQ